MKNDNFAILTADERRLHLLAVLDFDGVPETDRVGYLMRIGKLSKYIATRVLNGHYPRDIYKLFNITDALDIDFEWFMVGTAAKYHPRTLRIHLQQLKHYPQNDVDKMLRLMVAVSMGHKKACNLANFAYAGKISMLSAARML